RPCLGGSRFGPGVAARAPWSSKSSERFGARGSDPGAPGGESWDPVPKHSSTWASRRACRRRISGARAFYADKLGLAPVEERPGGLLYRCGSGLFALFDSRGAPSGSHTQMGIEVSDLRAAVAALRARGVQFEEYDAPGFKTV